MPLPISVSNTFAGATAAIPLSQLDANFTTVVNGVNGIGNGTNSLANVSITGGAISNASVASSNVTITGGTLNGVSITNATAFTSGNVTITGGTINNASVTNAVTITSANLAVTGGTMGNVTITGGLINNSSINTANVTIRGGTINNTSVTNAITLTSSNVTITGGSISNVTLSNVSTAPTNGYLRNRIINGAMQVDQRNNGSQFTLTNGNQVYTLDRWIVYISSATANVLVQRYPTSPAGGAQNQYLLSVSGNSTEFNAVIAQRIEQLNSYDLSNQTATLSFDWLTGTGGAVTVTWRASYANTVNTFGTFASPTKTQIATGTVSTTSSVVRYTVSFSVPAAATTGIEIAFTINDVGGGGGSAYYLGNVQLEAGSTATPFERRLYGESFDLCSRYYQKLGAYVPAAQAMFSFPTVMRVAPTITGGGTGYASPNIYTNGVGHSQTAAASQTAMQFTSEL